MHLIILLVALALDRFTQFSGMVQNYRWFPCYLAKMQQYLGSSFLWKDGLPLVCWLLPPVLLVLLLQLVLSCFFWGILGYVFNLLVLIYCLGPTNIRLAIGEYFTAKESGDNKAAQQALPQMESQEELTAEVLAQEASHSILRLGNRGILGLILWFLVFGAFGAVLYKMVALLQREADHAESLVTLHRDAVNCWMALLDWVPVRVTSLLYALVGNFAGSFHHWWHQLWTKPSNNEQFLKDCGLAALNVQPDYIPKNLEDSAIDLVDRSIIMMLVIVALMTIAAWMS